MIMFVPPRFGVLFVPLSAKRLPAAAEDLRPPVDIPRALPTVALPVAEPQILRVVAWPELPLRIGLSALSPQKLVYSVRRSIAGPRRAFAAILVVVIFIALIVLIAIPIALIAENFDPLA
jgi:hypothetical protein